MTEKPAKPVISRRPDDEAELEVWAESFAAVLGEPTRRAEDD